MKNQLYYKKLLSRGLMYVEFIKKDGSLRKMWCTRDNKIIQESGHEFISFSQGEIIGRERRFKNHLFVYDLQEGDTRILNIETINEKTMYLFESLDEVEIPEIMTRFTKKELGIVDEIVEVDNAENIEENVESNKTIEENVLGISDSEIDDIFK